MDAVAVLFGAGQCSTLPQMPNAFDDQQRALLRRLLVDHASNCVEFLETAMTGGHRRDEGLFSLLPAEMTPIARQAAMKEALVRFLDEGGNPTVKREPGDAQMQLDPVTDYHFRITCCNVRLFVKACLMDDESDDPTLLIKSVKRDDKAWK